MVVKWATYFLRFLALFREDWAFKDHTVFNKLLSNDWVKDGMGKQDIILHTVNLPNRGRLFPLFAPPPLESDNFLMEFEGIGNWIEVLQITFYDFFPEMKT